MGKKGDRIEIRSATSKDYSDIIKVKKDGDNFRASSDNPETYDRTRERDPDSMLVAIGHGIVRRGRFLGVVFTKYDPEDHYQIANIYDGAIIPGYKRRLSVKRALENEASGRLLDKLVQRAEQLIDEQVEHEKETLEKQGVNPEERKQELKGEIDIEALKNKIIIRPFS